MFRKRTKDLRYGQKIGKIRKTGLCGRVHELNKAGDIMPEDPKAESFEWTFGKGGNTFGESVRVVKK